MSKASSKQVSVVLRDCTLYFSEDEDSEDWQKALPGVPSKDCNHLQDQLGSSIFKPEIIINSEGEEETNVKDHYVPKVEEALPRCNPDEKAMKKVQKEHFEILPLKKTVLKKPQETSGREETIKGLYNPDYKQGCSTRNLKGVSTMLESKVLSAPRTQLKFTTDQAFALDYCNNSFNKKENPSQYFKMHTLESSYICANCGISFSSDECRAKHQNIHTSRDTISCPNCGTKLFQKDSLSSVQVDTVEQNPFHCTECEKSFQSDDDLVKHWAFHLDNPHWCAVCEISFQSRHDLRAHQNIHTGAKRFQCKDCGKRFRASFELVAHCQIHNKKEKKQKKPLIQGKKRIYKEEKQYHCTVCEKCFDYKTELNIHERFHLVETPTAAAKVTDGSLRVQS